MSSELSSFAQYPPPSIDIRAPDALTSASRDVSLLQYPDSIKSLTKESATSRNNNNSTNTQQIASIPKAVHELRHTQISPKQRNKNAKMSARDAITQMLQQRTNNQGISQIHKGGSKLLGTPSLPILSPMLPKNSTLTNQNQNQHKFNILSVQSPAADKNNHNNYSTRSLNKPSFANTGARIMQNSSSLTTL